MINTLATGGLNLIELALEKFKHDKGNEHAQAIVEIKNVIRRSHGSSSSD